MLLEIERGRERERMLEAEQTVVAIEVASYPIAAHHPAWDVVLAKSLVLAHAPRRLSCCRHQLLLHLRENGHSNLHVLPSLPSGSHVSLRRTVS